MNIALWILIDMASMGMGAPAEPPPPPVQTAAVITIPAPPTPAQPGVWVCETQYGTLTFDDVNTPGVSGCVWHALACIPGPDNPADPRQGGAWECEVSD